MIPLDITARHIWVSFARRGLCRSPLPFRNDFYSLSKSAAAWFSIKINMEDRWLHSFSPRPGWIHTDLAAWVMWERGHSVLIKRHRLTLVMIGPEESCNGMMKLLGETTEEEIWRRGGGVTGL